MSKPRAKTIQARFGFADDDLTTPKHDEIMLWVNAHAPDILSAFVEDIEEASEPAKIDKVIWEAPVMSGKYIVGFVDMLIKYSREVHKGTDRITGEERIERMHGFVLCIEVKTSMSSMGELIRQIRMYQQYQGGKYVVVSPDDRFADALREQGIEFYHYDPDAADVAML